MSFLKNLLRKKIRPCPPHNQEQIDSMTQTIDDTNTKLDFLEKFMQGDAFNKLMIVKKEGEKKDGLDSISVRRSCGC